MLQIQTIPKTIHLSLLLHRVGVSKLWLDGCMQHTPWAFCTAQEDISCGS